MRFVMFFVMRLIRKAKLSEYCELPLARNHNNRMRRLLVGIALQNGVVGHCSFGPSIGERYLYLSGGIL